MKRNFFGLSILLLILIMVTIFFLNRLNKNEIKDQFEKIAFAEGATIKTLVESTGSLLMDEDEKPLKKFLQRLYQNRLIIYIGLFRGEQLIYLLSRFEGYFPIQSAPEEGYVIDSPIGKILNIRSNFKSNHHQNFTIHIGFSYDFLSILENTARRNYLIMAGIFTVIILLISSIILYFDKQSYRRELELEKEKQEKDRFRELSVLTAEIAHEIKNPLNSIYLSFNTLEQHLCHDADPKINFYRDAIKNEIQRITKILQSYASLSKDILPHIKPTNLPDLMKEITLILQKSLEQSQTEIRFTYTGVQPLNTDPDLIKQIFFNLITNALDAQAKHIDVSFSMRKSLMQVNIRDDGLGIPDTMAADIFKPYISSKTKGMGLGLHVVNRIIKKLNGKIDLISYDKGKTEFELTIPEGESPDGKI